MPVSQRIEEGSGVRSTKPLKTPDAYWTGAQFILKYLGLIKRYFPGEDTNLSVLRALL
jgi:hypothetical protein